MYLFRDTPVDLNSNLRIIHAIPSALKVDIYLSGELIATNLSFGEVSNYKNIQYGEYEFQLFKAGTYDTPLYTTEIYIYPKSFNTMSIVTNDSKISLLQLKDATSLSEDATLSFIRFINLSPNAPLLNLALPNGEQLFNGVEYLETTGYYPLSPGIYNFKVYIYPAQGIYKYINEVKLSPGEFITIYIVGLYKDNPALGYVLTHDGAKI